MGRECRLVWPQGLGAGPGCPQCQPPVPTTHIVASRAISLLCLPHEPLWGRPCGVRCLASAVPSPTWDPHPAVRWGPSRWGLCPPLTLRGTSCEDSQGRGGGQGVGQGVGWGSDVRGKGPSRALASLWPQHDQTGPEHSGSTGRHPRSRSRLGTHLWSWGGEEGSAERCDLRMP